MVTHQPAVEARDKASTAALRLLAMLNVGFKHAPIF